MAVKMPDQFDEIISELEYAFLDEPPFRHSVKTKDGEIVRLKMNFWNASSVLKKHQEEGDCYLIVKGTKQCLTDLLDAFNDGIFPKDLSSLLNLLLLMHQLMLKELFLECLDRLYETENFTTVEYPPECSAETVMLCFNALLDRPIRTAEVYKEQLTRIAKHFRNNRDVMTNAINTVKQKLKKLSDIGIDAIPLGFDKRTMPIVVSKQVGRMTTAIIIGDELVNVNLFGKNFNIEKLNDRSDFYLKYGSYVLYVSDGKVYRKNLKDESDPIGELSDCRRLLTRGKFVFALVATKDAGSSDYYSVFRWVGDEKFVEIYQTTTEIKSIDFQIENRILAMAQSSGVIQLFNLKNDVLTLRQVRRECKTIERVHFMQTQLAVVSYYKGMFSVYTYALSDFSSVAEKRLGSSQNHFLKIVAGKFFYKTFDSLILGDSFPRYDTPGSRVLLADGACTALSEVLL